MSAPAAPQTNARDCRQPGSSAGCRPSPWSGARREPRSTRATPAQQREQRPAVTIQNVSSPVKSYPRVRVPEHVPYLARSFSESASSESSDGSRRRGKRGRRQKHRGRTIAGLSPLARRIAEAIADQAAVTALVTHLLEMRERTGPPAETRIEHTTLDDVFSVSSGSPAPC
jgi:hypothetical protein